MTSAGGAAQTPAGASFCGVPVRTRLAGEESGEHSASSRVLLIPVGCVCYSGDVATVRDERGHADV